jgi:hypothetical protein
VPNQQACDSRNFGYKVSKDKANLAVLLRKSDCPLSFIKVRVVARHKKPIWQNNQEESIFCDFATWHFQLLQNSQYN